METVPPIGGGRARGEGVEEVKAVGNFVHVFVERESRRPAAQGMGEDLKKGLGAIVVSELAKL